MDIFTHTVLSINKEKNFIRLKKKNWCGSIKPTCDNELCV